MRRRQLNQQLNQEAVILPHLPWVTTSLCPPFVSSPGQHAQLGTESSYASHHALQSHARPTLLDRAMQVGAPVGAADHIALIRSLHPCAPSLVPGPEYPAGIQAISCQHHPPQCDVMPALVGQSGRTTLFGPGSARPAGFRPFLHQPSCTAISHPPPHSALVCQRDLHRSYRSFRTDCSIAPTSCPLAPTLTRMPYHTLPLLCLSTVLV